MRRAPRRSLHCVPVYRIAAAHCLRTKSSIPRRVRRKVRTYRLRAALGQTLVVERRSDAVGMPDDINLLVVGLADPLGQRVERGVRRPP